MTYDEIDEGTLEDFEELESSQEYKTLVERGIEARKKGDLSNWELGDRAIEVIELAKEKAEETGRGFYGDQVLKRYAESIGVEENSLYEYKRISEKFESSSRLEFSSLSWSHFQLAADRDNSEGWLQKAKTGTENKAWSKQVFKDAIAESLGKKTSTQREIERVLDLTGKSPAEGLREILRLFMGHEADHGAEEVIKEMLDDLPLLRERDMKNISAAYKYLIKIYNGVKLAEENEN